MNTFLLPTEIIGETWRIWFTHFDAVSSHIMQQPAARKVIEEKNKNTDINTQHQWSRVRFFPKSDIFSFPYHVTHYVQWTPAITSLTSTPISFIHIWPHLSIRCETASLLKMKKCHIFSVLNNISKFTTTVSLQQHFTVLNNNNIAILNNITTWQNLISPQIQDMKNQSWKTSLEKSWIKTNNPQKIQDVQMPTQTHSH